MAFHYILLKHEHIFHGFVWFQLLYYMYINWKSKYICVFKSLNINIAKYYKIGMCCFFLAKHEAWRCKKWLTPSIQDNASEWSNMSTCRLLFNLINMDIKYLLCQVVMPQNHIIMSSSSKDSTGCEW